MANEATAEDPNGWIKLAQNIKNSTYNLVITEKNDLDNRIYFDNLKKFIGTIEGATNYAYLDGIPDPDNPKKYISKAKFYALDEEKQKELREAYINHPDNKNKTPPITTVGIGCNIEGRATRERLNNLLGEEGLMEQVYYGKKDITNQQIGMIFRDGVEFRAQELRNHYGKNWDKFKANERVVTSSLYFNGTELAKRGSSFHANMMKYAETKDPEYLEKAIYEVEKRSNGGNKVGIQNRRNAEAVLLNSENFPKHLSINRGINQDYFIWRTQGDSNVRPQHKILEGKIFRKDNPPGGYMPGIHHNCRCHAEEVPDRIKIKEDETEDIGADKTENEVSKKAFEIYLRKGTWHSSLNNYKSPAKESLNYLNIPSVKITEQKAFELYLRKGIRHPLLCTHRRRIHINIDGGSGRT